MIPVIEQFDKQDIQMLQNILLEYARFGGSQFKNNINFLKEIAKICPELKKSKEEIKFMLQTGKEIAEHIDYCAAEHVRPLWDKLKNASSLITPPKQIEDGRD